MGKKPRRDEEAEEAWEAMQALVDSGMVTDGDEVFVEFDEHGKPVAWIDRTIH